MTVIIRLVDTDHILPGQVLFLISSKKHLRKQENFAIIEKMQLLAHISLVYHQIESMTVLYVITKTY